MFITEYQNGEVRMGLGAQIAKLKSRDFSKLVRETVTHLAAHSSMQKKQLINLNACITRTNGLMDSKLCRNFPTPRISYTSNTDFISRLILASSLRL